MKDDVSRPSTVTSGNPAQRSLVEDMREVFDAGKELAKAEAVYQKARVAYAGKGARNLAIIGAVALALVFFALMALTFGLVLSLAPILTPVGATAAVVCGLLIVALLCAMVALNRWRQLKDVLSETGDDDA